jgi:hypothetical protein
MLPSEYISEIMQDYEKGFRTKHDDTDPPA